MRRLPIPRQSTRPSLPPPQRPADGRGGVGLAPSGDNNTVINLGTLTGTSEGLNIDSDFNTVINSRAIAGAPRIHIMVQDAPLWGADLSVAFLARLAREVPLVRYFKVEVAGAAAKLRSLIDAGGETIAGPFDGEESITLMADLDAGATGTMPSALLPDLIRPVVDQHRAGRRTEAAAAYARILPLINFENRQCGLRATKAVMAEGGVIKSDAVRHPLERLHPATRAGLLELARDVAPLALRWGR